MCIFIMSYMNITVFMATEGPSFFNWDKAIVPKGLSKSWFEIYGNCVFTSTLTTAFIPYAGPVISIMLKFCGRKALTPGRFNMERKYAIMLTTLFIAFTYGYAIPMLFLSVSLCFFVQFVFDKVLVTYWFKVIPIKSDSLINLSIKIIKYAPLLMIIISARCL